MKKYTAKEIAEYLATSGTEFEWQRSEQKMAKETRTFTIGGREQDYTVGAIFEVNGHEVEFTPCTAIATCADETERSSAIFVHDTTDEFGDGDGVIFGVLMPASNEEAEDMIMYEFIDTYYETHETIEF